MLPISSFLAILIISVGVKAQFLQRGGRRYQNNVCGTVLDYLFLETSHNCWHNPDVHGSARTIITTHGYPLESYDLTTDDGYIINLSRIPSAQENSSVIFIQHGITDTMLSFLALGNDSLPFRLHDLGYDVWMGNFRGSVPSAQHVNLNITDADYWNFSFYELAIHDLPVFLGFIENATSSKIIYFGHSMGATTGMIYSIRRNEIAMRQLRAFIFVAPVIYMGPGISRILTTISVFGDRILAILRSLEIYHGGVSNFAELTSFYQRCYFGNRFTRFACILYSAFVMRRLVDRVIPEMIPVYLKEGYAGFSLRTFHHYGQIINNGGNLQEYDYGTETNQEIYGSVNPPLINVTENEIPTYIIYGKLDSTADEQDVLKLYQVLGNSARAIRGFSNYRHLDFTFDDAYYDTLFSYLRQINGSLLE